MKKYLGLIYVLLAFLMLVTFSFFYAYYSTQSVIKEWSIRYQNNHGNFQLKFEISHFSIYEKFYSRLSNEENTFFFTYVFEYSFNHSNKRITRYIIYPIFSLSPFYVFK